MTLTFANENLPTTPTGVPTVDVRHLQLLHKRLRKAGNRYRYVGVGEYGDRYGRPHYHLAMWPKELTGIVAVEDTLAEHWPDRVEVSDLVQERMSYLCGYTTKKMTRAEDPRLRGDQRPEFMTQSSKPAIGCSAQSLEVIARLCNTKGGQNLIADTLDVPREFRYNGKTWPLDRTVRRHLRAFMGIPETDERRQAPHMEPPTIEEAQIAEAAEQKARRRSRKGVF